MAKAKLLLMMMSRARIVKEMEERAKRTRQSRQTYLLSEACNEQTNDVREEEEEDVVTRQRQRSLPPQ